MYYDIYYYTIYTMYTYIQYLTICSQLVRTLHFAGAFPFNREAVFCRGPTEASSSRRTSPRGTPRLGGDGHGFGSETKDFKASYWMIDVRFQFFWIYIYTYLMYIYIYARYVCYIYIHT